MLTAVCLAFLVPATVAAGYYVLLTTVGWLPSRGKIAIAPRTRFTVLVPAHDEEASLPDTLASVFAADYPADLRRVLVVADNCVDRTAAVARGAGADVLERFDAAKRGKGYALAAGLPRAVADRPDAVMVLDADCDLDPAAFRVLDAEFRAGADVVQAAVRSVRPDDGPGGLIAAVGSEIENGVQAGLTALGRPTWLRGTGMAFRREVVERFPWRAFGLAEDAEYAGHLRRAGVRVRFAAGAAVRCQPPPRTGDFCRQRRRWRAALFAGGKGRLDRAVASKPLVLGHLASTLIAAASLGQPWALLWAIGLSLATAVVYLRAARRVGASAGRHVWQVPGVIARLAWVTAGGFVQRGGVWERTSRAAG
jgi:1,2-diacylglycerol 3-beta-glucosyltransferase